MKKSLTKEKIYALRDKYLGKRTSGWDIDKETGAIIVYAIDGVYLDGNYYSMKNADNVKFENYIQYIRKYVGHAPIQAPGTGIIVHKKRKGELEILLQLRVDCNKYGLPGGGIEFGESYEEGAVNELLQETALAANPKDLKLFNVYAGPKHITKYPNGDIVYHTVVVYKLDYDKCKRTNHQVDKEETKALEWMTISQIKEILRNQKVFPNNIPILEDIVQKF